MTILIKKIFSANVMISLCEIINIAIIAMTRVCKTLAFADGFQIIIKSSSNTLNKLILNKDYITNKVNTIIKNEMDY